MLLLLLLFAIVPVVAFRLARVRHPEHLYLATGSALGAVAAPLSLGLYSTYFIPYVGLVPGMVGLALTIVHSAPGFHLARMFGLVAPSDIISGGGEPWFAFLNGVVWGAGYGSLGWLVDRLRQYRSNAGGVNGHG